MGRHRIPEYEIREVSNAYAPAVARREPEGDPRGRIVVEVDERLRGRERDDAIQNALEPYRQGWRGILPAPVLAMLWAGARAVREHQLAAAAAATVTAAAGMMTLTVTGVLETTERPAANAASTAVTQTVESTSLTLDEPTASASTPPREPRRSREPATPGREPAEAAFDGRPERATQQPARSPAPEPTHTTKSAEPKRTPTPRQSSHTDAADVREEDRPTPSREPDRPTVDEQPDRPTPEPQPEPEPKRTPDPVIEVKVGGDDCHLVDLDVGVGDLLGAGVCV